MYLLVSTPIEAFHRMMRLRALSRTLTRQQTLGWTVPDLLPGVRAVFGGRLVLLDWDNRRVLAQYCLPGVMGLTVDGETIYGSSWIEHGVSILAPPDAPVHLSHPWFSYLHGISVTPQGTLLVTCTGTDLLVEVDRSGEILWSWFGAEHGFVRCPDGRRAFFDREADYRRLRRDTADQAMHLTSALMIGGGTVLATLYHQGRLVAIDRATGTATTVLDGLIKPHAVHPRPEGGYLLCDTLGHRILLLDAALAVECVIPYGTQWLQDAVVSSRGTLLTLENACVDRDLEPGVSNYLTELDPDGHPLRRLNAGLDCRLFNVCEVTPAHAARLAQAWSDSGPLPSWRWEG